jgi:phosphoribosyl 1,2-cyclic phosphate phosphodiesterase
MRFTILGCGSSPGVPRIGGDWGACDPHNPKNRRRRSALLVQRISGEGVTTVVIDTGPDFREQMIDANVAFADGVVFTHAHADHIHGLDDLRSFVINRRRLVEIYADEETSERLHDAFGYCFKTPEGSRYPPILRENRIEADVPFTITGEGGPIDILPFRQIHGDITSLGFRFGHLAYSSDVSDLDDMALSHLANLDLWIVDALQNRPHPSHFSLAETLQWIENVGPKRALLTHMHVPLDYDTVMRETPPHVQPAHDGLVIEFPI